MMIIDAGILAPSSKNRQPWKFYVLAGMDTTPGVAKKEILAAFRRGLERERAGQNVLLPNNSQHIAAAEYSSLILRPFPIYFNKIFRKIAAWFCGSSLAAVTRVTGCFFNLF